MKKSISHISICLVLILLFMFAFVGCNNSENDQQAETDEYVLQYTDDAGTHSITVVSGMPYALEAVPARYGYDFLGLYDAQVGGTQYVSDSGASLSPFTDNKNMVLFPQFKAKEFTLFLDYQGSQLTGNREYQVSFNSRLPELPKNLALEHNDFIGWFTKPNAEGVQVADNYGLLSSTSYVNEQNFDLSQDNKFLYLYAGFEAEKHTVTFCFESGMNTEEVQVPYNTPISDVVPTTRVNGNAVLTWSKTQGGEVWNGKVEGEMVLYAVEYAPVIELDSNGGKKINPVVARAGSTISLPTPTKDLAKFSHWEDMQGNTYTSTTMPSKSISLKAVWQAKLVFDENGGSDVDDISVAAGTKITLPTSEKEGFIFAGWYMADKEQYTSTTMPAAGIALKAGWYKEKTDTVVVIGSTDVAKSDTKVPSTSNMCYTFNYKKYFSDNKNYTVKIDWHAKLKTSRKTTVSLYVDFYSQKQITSTYLMGTKSFDNVINEYREFNFSTTFIINDNFYICWYAPSGYDNGYGLYLKDFYYTIHYSDTTNLYL